MAEVGFLLIAIALLLVGHLLRWQRWQQFIEVYERPQGRNLMRALSLGFLSNLILPFHLGELVCIIIAGRKMENGIAFSLATVFVGRYLDLFVVGVIFVALVAMKTGGSSVLASMQFYIWAVLLLLPVTIILVKYIKYPKKIIQYIAGIFNAHIRLEILYVSWVVISAFKDMYLTLNKKKLGAFTLGMWISYVLSYAAFTQCLSYTTQGIGFVDVFSWFFSSATLNDPRLYISSTEGVSLQFLILCYMIVPLIVLLALSYMPETVRYFYHRFYNSPMSYLNLLPQLREEDQLNFLDGYFSNRNKKYLSMYLKINRDISIIRDYSAGSNATTMLCMDKEKTFFRKYAFGADGDKLYEQIEWLHNHEDMLPLPKILREGHDAEYCYYDMDFNSAAVSLFDFIHSVSADRSWAVLKRVLECLNTQLYLPTEYKPKDDTQLNRYLDEKVAKNLKKIKDGRQIKDILKYKTIVINGVEYPNLSAYEAYLSKEYLYNVFKDDTYAEIHGDLTIENIICNQEQGKDDFYLIDPNTGNLHDSPNLDYGKLLQSLHGGYEFLMKTQSVSISGNHIDFLYTKSLAYDTMFHQLVTYMRDTFPKSQVKSIFYHEIVHWLRLMPYKINKNGDRALIFYAGLILLLHDICKMEEM